MNTTGRWLFVFTLLSGLTVYGCAQQDSRSTNSRIRALEARNTKLESDYKVVTRANESYRSKLTQTEQHLADSGQTLTTTAQERDELRSEMAQRAIELAAVRKHLAQAQTEIQQRIGERNVLKSQLTELSQELQVMAGRIETVLHGGTPRPNSAALIVDIE